jgi:hypothetical protein
MTEETFSNARGLASVFLGEFIANAEENGDALTDETKRATMATSAMFILYELLPFWERIPKSRRIRLLDEYEKVVSDYTPDQVAGYLNHSLPDMKKKLVFYVAVAKHAITKIQQ